MHYFLRKSACSFKIEETNLKSHKNYSKNWEICAHLEFKSHYPIIKKTVVSILEIRILIQLTNKK